MRNFKTVKVDHSLIENVETDKAKLFKFEPNSKLKFWIPASDVYCSKSGDYMKISLDINSSYNLWKKEGKRYKIAKEIDGRLLYEKLNNLYLEIKVGGKNE